MALTKGEIATKQTEILETITELEKPKLYEKVTDLQYDLNTRLKIALTTGQDPLGLLSITQIYEDIQTVNKLRNIIL